MFAITIKDHTIVIFGWSLFRFALLIKNHGFIFPWRLVMNLHRTMFYCIATEKVKPFWILCYSCFHLEMYNSCSFLRWLLLTSSKFIFGTVCETKKRKKNFLCSSPDIVHQQQLYRSVHQFAIVATIEQNILLSRFLLMIRSNDSQTVHKSLDYCEPVHLKWIVRVNKFSKMNQTSHTSLISIIIKHI